MTRAQKKHQALERAADRYLYWGRKPARETTNESFHRALQDLHAAAIDYGDALANDPHRRSISRLGLRCPRRGR